MYNPLKKIWHFFLNLLYNRIKERMQQEKYAQKEERINKILRSFKQIGEGATFVYDDYYIHGAQYIDIGNNFLALHHLRLEAIDFFAGHKFSPSISIGNNVSIQDFCHIGCIEKIEIGDDVMIASKVFITDHFHGNITEEDIKNPPIKRTLTSQPVKIGKNVWIGENVSIMPGVTIGNNVIIGANSVITHSFPDNSVIAGCPAKILKTLI